MSSIARKIKREEAILKRKSQRAALKDTAIREMYDKQLLAGYERGYVAGAKQAMTALLDDLAKHAILSDEQYATYKEKVDGTEGPTHP